MATRSERARATAQRKGPTKRATKAAAAKKDPHAARKVSEHAGAKATFALEAHAPSKRPSRKSSRSSANRAKSGSAADIREERAFSAPSAQARLSKIKATKVRGKGR